jgi:hypothetical protein
LSYPQQYAGPAVVTAQVCKFHVLIIATLKRTRNAALVALVSVPDEATSV